MPRRRDPEIGRPKVERPKLPKLDRHVLEEVTAWLTAKRNTHRPPTVAAQLLYLVVLLDREGIPFPTREQLAVALGAGTRDKADMGKSTIDSAKNGAIYNEEIAEEYRTVAQDHPTKDVSLKRERYMVPSAELKSVVRAAERRLERRSA